MGSHIFLPSRGRTTNNYETVEHHAQRRLAMTYYRYITGVYKSYWPELNRTLRSSSVPRHVPQPVPARTSRASSVPSSSFCSSSRYSATPFRDRALSVPPREYHYSDLDYKVMDYQSRLAREDTIKTCINQTRKQWSAMLYNYYESDKCSSDYLPRSVMGDWKHFHLSQDTLNYRNNRARSPLVTREINRYYEKRSNYVGDVSSAGSDFRHYNYRRVPYFGGSDGYKFMKTNPFQGSRGF